MKIDISIFGEQKPRQRKDIFKCNEPVIVALNRLNLKGFHILEVHWFKPDGKRQEVTRTKYNEVKNKVQDVQFKLVISPKSMPSEGVISTLHVCPVAKRSTGTEV